MATQKPHTEIVTTIFCHGPPPELPAHNDSQPTTNLPLVTALTDLLFQSVTQDFTYTTKVLDRIAGTPHPRIIEVILTFASPRTSHSLRTHPSIPLFESHHSVELVFQPNDIYRRYKRLAVFDMDSTLIQQEVIDLIAARVGVEDKVSAITERAMNGELDFTASLRERCALLKGVPASVFTELRDVITLTPGVPELIRALKKLGYRTAVLSGGFTPLASWQAQQLGLDYAFANHLVVSEDGQTLTGELEGEIVHAEKKRQHVLEIAAREGIMLEQVIAIGDGANDLPMMGVAGLGVAFNAKPKVQREAPAKLNSGSLLDVLYLFGLSRGDIEELIGY